MDEAKLLTSRRARIAVINDLGDTCIRYLGTGQLSELAENTYPPGLPDPPNPYRLLGKWAHMLGFRGHFASKSRRYSTTLGRLRSARRRFERAKAVSPDGIVDVAALDQELADDETTLVINDWRFTGTGWITAGDAALAAEAGAKAREYANTKRAPRSCTSSGTTSMEDTCVRTC